MRDRENVADNVGPLEPNVLDGDDSGRDRGLDTANPAIEAPEDMVGVHAGEHIDERTRKRARQSTKQAKKKTVKKLQARKRIGQSRKIVGRLAKKQAPEPRERGGASIPCVVCEGPTRVLATRRIGEGRWPGKKGGVWRRRLCKRRTCRAIFETEEYPRLVDNYDRADD